MVDFLPAIIAEMEALEADLRRDVRYVKLQELRRVRVLWDPDYGALDITSFGVSPSAAHRSARKSNPERDKALAAATAFVFAQAGPVPTNDVLQHLALLGIEVGGAEPRNTLSAMMSNSGQFTSNGRKGWTIREAGDPAERDEENASDSPLPAFMAPPTVPRRGPPQSSPMSRRSEIIDDDIPF